MSPLSGSVLLRRLPWCLLPLVLGAGAALWLLLVAGAPVRVVRAAPNAVTFPGCGATIQACIDNAPDGETIIVQPGTYVTSLSLWHRVSLIGVNSQTVILQAPPGQRVLVVAGPTVDSSVVISGLTLMGGSALGSPIPTGFGGGILITSTAKPRLVNLRLLANTAMVGGGIFANGELSLEAVEIISNSANAGGGAFAVGPMTVQGGRFERNTAIGSGGGLAGNSTVAINGTQFLSNTAPNGGGALTIGSAIVQGALFQANACAQPSTCRGGGLFASGSASVRGGVFVGNSSGIFAGQSVDVSGTRFINNALVGLQLGTPVDSPASGRLIKNALFAGSAPGLVVGRDGEVAVLHSTFANPTPGSDAALVIFTGTVGITNNIFTNHTIGISLTTGTAWESHNLFFGNTTNTTGAVTSSGGSQNADPLFRNPAADDYHLRFGSPAIDMGVDAAVTSDIDGQVRPQGGGFDAGYDEYRELNNKVFLPFIRR
jgi:hypothetical protein